MLVQVDFNDEDSLERDIVQSAEFRAINTDAGLMMEFQRDVDVISPVNIDRYKDGGVSTPKTYQQSQSS